LEAGITESAHKLLNYKSKQGWWYY